MRSWIKEDVVFMGLVDEAATRIVRKSQDDCVVERMEDGRWEACDDLHATHAYMAAFLQGRGPVRPVDHGEFEVPLVNRGKVKVCVRDHPQDGVGLVMKEGEMESWRAFADWEMVRIRDALDRRIRLEAGRIRARIAEAARLTEKNVTANEEVRKNAMGSLRDFVHSLTSALGRLVP